MYITIRAGYTMTIKEIRQHKNNTIRQQIFTYLIHVRKEISFIDTRFFTVSLSIESKNLMNFLMACLQMWIYIQIGLEQGTKNRVLPSLRSLKSWMVLT